MFNRLYDRGDSPKSLFLQSGLNPSRTLEEEYIHCIHYLEDKGSDISEVYNHEEYIAAKKTSDITDPNLELDLEGVGNLMVLCNVVFVLGLMFGGLLV